MNLPILPDSALVWFRRDLRDYDHAALALALQSARAVYCAFVFDHDILNALPGRCNRRLTFIHASLHELDTALRARGGGLMVRAGKANTEIPALAMQLDVQAVFANRDYEPAAKERDQQVAAALARSGITFISPKDQVIFDGDDILTSTGKSFSVFTPYARAWLRRLHGEGVMPFKSDGRLTAPPSTPGLPALSELGFTATDLAAAGLRPGMSGAQSTWSAFRKKLDRYAAGRDYPATAGTSGLSPHLRFGTLSIRELVAHAAQQTGTGPETWLKELIWREFYFQILDHFPHVANGPFKHQFATIPWNDWPEGLLAWKEGRTGYPLIDAAMRHFNRTGQMHNRLRMITASFLCKDLGIDWRLGERHFANGLNDFDLAANNGGWQWCASTGCDAQPWFRIFNPVTQSEKFDPGGVFIRRHLPELEQVPSRYLHAPWRMPLPMQKACGIVIGRDYPAPIVNHETARQRTLERYRMAKENAPRA